VPLAKTRHRFAGKHEAPIFERSGWSDISAISALGPHQVIFGEKHVKCALSQKPDLFFYYNYANLWFSTVHSMKKLVLLPLLLLTYALSSHALKVSQPAPEFSLKAIKNYSAEKPLSLKDFRGKVVYVDFFASWCIPCRQSLPFLNNIRNRYSDRGFEVVAVNLDEDPKAAMDFIKRFNIDYPVVVDPSGKVAESYGLQGMPNSFLVDRSGKVRDIHIGFQEKDKTKVERAIISVLN